MKALNNGASREVAATTHRQNNSEEEYDRSSALLEPRMDRDPNYIFPHGLSDLKDKKEARFYWMRLMFKKFIPTFNLNDPLREEEGRIESLLIKSTRDFVLSLPQLSNSTIMLSYSRDYMYLANIPIEFFQSMEAFEKALAYLSGDPEFRQLAGNPDNSPLLLKKIGEEGEEEEGLRMKGADTVILTVGSGRDEFATDGPSQPPKYPAEIEKLKDFCRDNLGASARDVVYVPYDNNLSQERSAGLLAEWSVLKRHFRALFTDNRYGETQGALELTRPDTFLP